MDSADLHWRNTQKPVRFFFVDARAFFPLFIFLVHARSWTFGLTILTLFVFWLMERRGLSFDSALRALRAWLVGVKRPGVSRRVRRRWVDYG